MEAAARVGMGVGYRSVLKIKAKHSTRFDADVEKNK
jgi:hypothetical protein